MVRFGKWRGLNRRSPIRLGLVAGGVLAALLASMPCSTPAFAAEARVVVTLKPVHALVSEIMDGVGKPLLIVDGAASPHTFTLKPSAARAISEADVFIRVSESLEPFTHKVADALPASVTLVSLIDAPGLALRDQRRGDTFENHGHEKGHDGHDDHQDGAARDSHIWLDPLNAKAIVDHVTKLLSQKYPDAAAKLHANATALNAKIDALTAEITSDLTPVKDKPFIVFHDAIQYFEARFGMSAAGSVTVSPDVQPSAKRLTAVRKKIVQLGAACVFSEPGFQPKLVAAVTEGTAARAGTLDPEGVAIASGPNAYFELMRGLSRSLKACLSSS